MTGGNRLSVEGDSTRLVKYPPKVWDRMVADARAFVARHAIDEADEQQLLTQLGLDQ